MAARLIDPPLATVGDVVDRNASGASAYDYDVQGRSLRNLAQQARAELAAAAWNYTRAYRDAPQPHVTAATRLFVAGHQPQLFHPGVWFKNFVLSTIGQRCDALAINLAIDSDTIKTASLRVPSGSAAAPVVESVPYDRPTAEIPYEARAIVDRECLNSFGKRAAETIHPLVADPFVARILAAGRRARAALRQPGRVHRAGPASARGPVGRRDLGDSAKPRLRFAGVPLVRLPFVRATAADVGPVQSLGGRLPPREPRSFDGASGARPGDGRRLAGGAVLDLGPRRSAPPANCSSASGATRSFWPTGNRSSSRWPCRPTATRPARPSNWPSCRRAECGCAPGR